MKDHQYRWSPGGNRIIFEVANMVVSWWIVAFLHSEGKGLALPISLKLVLTRITAILSAGEHLSRNGKSVCRS